MRKRGVTYDAFDVVVVPFPFTDLPVSKKRPALVLSRRNFNARHRQLTLAMITTAKNSDWPSDMILQDWADAGLPRASRVRFKLFTLDQDLILGRLGTLSPKDQATAKTALAACMAVD
jgi:mRNA interferase MazF